MAARVRFSLSRMGATLHAAGVRVQDSLVASFSADSIAAVAPNIQELDLRGNLLSSLPALATLGHQLPKLAMLNLGDNRFAAAAPADVAALAGCFPALRVLVLSGSNLPWSQIQQLEPAFPALEELHLCRNNMSTFDAPVSGFPLLQVFNASDNAFADWREIAKLGALPSLRRLLLTDNAIAVVHAGTDGEAGTGAGAGAGDVSAGGPFSSLTSLTLSGNAVSSWSGLHGLLAYPSITALRFQNNPLTSSMSPSQARQALIARVAQLTALNGSPVREREREDAEKAFLRMPPEDFKATPRYAELVGKHGAVPGAGGGAGGPATLADSVIKVTLRSMAASSSEMDAVQKRLPMTMTVQALKQLVGRLFKCDVALTRLSVRHSPDSYPELLEEDMRSLAFYALTDGSEVLVEEVDPREAARLADTAAQAQAQRMADQQASTDALLAAKEHKLSLQKAAAASAGAAGGTPPTDGDSGKMK